VDRFDRDLEIAPVDVADIGTPTAVRHVVPGDVVHGRDAGIVAATALDNIGPAITGDQILARPTFDVVHPGATRHQVGAATAAHRVTSAPTVDPIVPEAAVDLVIAPEPDDRVVPTQPADHVVTRGPAERVVTTGPDDRATDAGWDGRRRLGDR